MNRFYGTLVIAVVLMLTGITTMTAQTRALYLSSVSGSNIEQYDGQVRNVTMYRSVFNGWNTLCLPFSMTSAELEEAFGSSCKLETLSDVKAADNGTYYLYFKDVKKDGVKANTPYLLYYSGENVNAKLTAGNTTIKYDNDPEISFSVNGTTVHLVGAVKHLDANGQYGIYVKDNDEANFTPVASSTSGFYATRCYITVDGATTPRFVSLHNTSSTATSINNIENSNETASDIYNVNGIRQNSLQKGVNIVDGKKVWVK